MRVLQNNIIPDELLHRSERAHLSLCASHFRFSSLASTQGFQGGHDLAVPSQRLRGAAAQHAQQGILEGPDNACCGGPPAVTLQSQVQHLLTELTCR